jgi:GNAT superfamily N-acetyltransferase
VDPRGEAGVRPAAGALRVRPVQLGDAPAIARLAGELGYPSTEEEVRARLAILLPDERCFAAVAAVGAEPCGWIAAEHRRSLDADERAEITGLVVGAGARRAGVGRALVAEAERWAAGRGLALVTVRSNAARLESHPFYESLGYARTKTQHYYRKPLADAGPSPSSG